MRTRPAIAALAAVLLAACGGSTKVGPPSLATTGAPTTVALTTAATAATSVATFAATTAPIVTTVPVTTTAPSDHETNLASGETASIAAQLVAVPGYSYVDAAEFEVENVLEIQRRTEEEMGADAFFFASLSLHGVVADDPSQNTAGTWNGAREVGFLQMLEFAEPPPAGIDESFATASNSGRAPVDRLEISGTQVSVFEKASSVDSRWSYSWLRHGVGAFFDGADRAPLERWLRLYLATPVLVPGETGTLSQRLVPLPGYAYANYEAPDVADTFVLGPLGPVAYSTHLVTDENSSIGGLVLAEVPSNLSTEQYVAALQQHGLTGFTELGTETIAGTPVTHVTSDDLHAFVWTEAGIAGLFMTRSADRAVTFLTAFLGSTR